MKIKPHIEAHFKLAHDAKAILKRLSEQNQTTQTAEVEAAIRERGQKQLQPAQE